MFQTTPKIKEKKTWDYIRPEQQKIDVEPLKKALAEEKKRQAEINANMKVYDKKQKTVRYKMWHD